MILTFLVIGLVKGSILALVSLGMVMIIKATKVINFAHGDFVMAGAFIGFTFMGSLKLPLWSAIPLTFVACGLTGYLVYQLIMKRMKHASLISMIMVTIGVSYLVNGLVKMFFGSQNYSMPAIFPTGTVSMAGVEISQLYIYTFFISIILMVLLVALFQFSRLGLAMRASADNPKAAQSLGIRINKVNIYSWIISISVAGVGGILMASMNVLNTRLAYIGIVVFPIIILGGLESLLGAVIGSLIIGIIESMVAGYINPMIGAAAEEVVAFVVLLIILMIRPHGLFGKKEVERL